MFLSLSLLEIHDYLISLKTEKSRIFCILSKFWPFILAAASYAQQP